MPNSANATAPFHIARKKLVDACIAFSERAVDSGVAMLIERVRSALVPLRSHFEGLGQGKDRPGRSIRLTTARQMKPLSAAVVSVLQSPGVAKVFSVSPAETRWPFDSSDPNGAKLVENAGSDLSLAQECKLGYTKFISLQRVAQEGARALQLVLTTDPHSEPGLLALISQTYTWGTSLRDYQQLP